MKTIASAVAIAALVSFTCPGPLRAADVPTSPVAWEVTEGLDRPESAYYDKASGFVFVSNIVGKGDEKDGEGWISKLTVEGKMVEPKWVTGLNAPKGMRSSGGVLWVSDLDRIVAFNIADGAKVHDIAVPDAKFLNDVAIGHDGTVYVTDMRGNRIVQVKDGKLSVFAEGEQLETPNGLLVSGTRLLCGGWSTGPDKAGHLYALDLRTKEKTLITPEIVGHVDGIELDGRGNYLISDWPGGTVSRIAPDGTATTLLKLEQGTADIAYLPEKNLLILPRMMQNKVTAYTLAAPEGSDDAALQALFNGKDLTGWETTGNWKVEADGAVSLTPREGEKGWQRYGAYLWTPKAYGDFEMHVEYNIPKGGNSGVYVRVKDKNSPVDTGIEVQVLDSFNNTKALGHHDHGGIIKTTGPSKNMSVPAEQWNHMIVTCRGHHMQVVLNGEQIIDIQLDQTPMKDRPAVGYIGIQDHGLPMQVRNIRIRELQ